jgi:hypothetical protein
LYLSLSTSIVTVRKLTSLQAAEKWLAQQKPKAKFNNGVFVEA